ncbi:hypothetical protein [Thermomonospora amylolytica]|uniref:hypothetical protein n=1 Tax=Thermomonospora amylolytica TaxID=1411117 RepID=UPI000E6D29F2|nr:hypothetical protein [Thermomonospora amylolytica]
MAEQTLIRRPNVSLLRLVLTHIEMHPHQWNQRDWRTLSECGTAYCFAGWTVVLSGGKFAVNPYSNQICQTRVVPAGVDPTDVTKWQHVAEYAADLLGITPPIRGDAVIHPLFLAINTLDDLRRVVAELCEAAGA